MTTAPMAPVSMATVGELMAILESSDPSMRAVGRIVETDIGLCSRILSVANSAQFGLSRQITDLSQALSLVGMNMTGTLAIAGATALLDSRSGFPAARDHALATAACARVIAERRGASKPDAFAAGLLHDIGELLLWQSNPDEYLRMWNGCASVDEQLAIERELYGHDHAELGATRLSEWCLPAHLVDAVGDHHAASAASSLLTIIVAAADEAVTDADHAPALTLLEFEGEALESLLDQTEIEHRDYLSLLVS